MVTERPDYHLDDMMLLGAAQESGVSGSLSSQLPHGAHYHGKPQAECFSQDHPQEDPLADAELFCDV